MSASETASFTLKKVRRKATGKPNAAEHRHLNWQAPIAKSASPELRIGLVGGFQGIALGLELAFSGDPYWLRGLQTRSAAEVITLFLTTRIRKIRP